MKYVKTLLPAAALGALAVLPAVSFAEMQTDGIGPYVGAGVGYHRLNEEDFGTTPTELDSEEMAYRGYAGWRFLPFLGVEGEYVDFGTNDDGNNSLDAHGYSAAAVGYLPLSTRFDIYGKVGQLFWDKSGRDNTGSTPFSFDDDGEDLFYGLGVGYGLTEHLGVKLEYDRYEMERTDVDLASANLEFRF